MLEIFIVSQFSIEMLMKSVRAKKMLSIFPATVNMYQLKTIPISDNINVENFDRFGGK